ncbi:MAG: ATP-binding protein [Gemmatimonadales bacterium]
MHWPNPESLDEVLSSPLDEAAMLAAVARLMVPQVCDLCLADLVPEDGTAQRVAVVGARPGDRLDAWKIPLATGRAAREPVLVPALTAAALADIAPDARAAAAIRGAGIHALVLLPLSGRTGLLGMLALGAVRTSRRFTRDDLPALRDLARHAALGVDNARLYDRTRQAHGARDDLLAVVSHDLRNGLNTVLTAAHLLLRELPPDNTRQRRHLEAIRRSAQRMNGLINDVVDVASLDAGRLVVDRRPQPVRNLLYQAVAAARPRAAEKGLRLECHVAGNAARAAVLGDRERLLQVFAHLIGNAVTDTTEGGIVSVSAEAEEDGVTFAVRDSGTGIPSEQLPRVFDRVGRATSRPRVGTALGLPIARGVVEALGGQIWVESAPGAGTTFFFTLRLATPQPEPPVHSQ